MNVACSIGKPRQPGLSADEEFAETERRSKLRVGVDARLLADELTGIGRYVSELCRQLDVLLPRAEFYVYAPWRIQLPVTSPRWRARIDPLSAIFARFDRLWMTKHVWMLSRMRALCARDSLNVFWATDAPFIPLLPRSVRIVSTVYDLRYIVAPETQRKTTLYVRRLLERRHARADALVAISEGTTEKLRRFLGYKAAGIVRPAVSKDFRRKSDRETARVLSRYGIHPPYLFSIANADATPHKNIELLVRVFRAMKHEGFLSSHALVIGGPKTDRLVERFVSECGGHAPDIMGLGYIAEDDLPALYSGADVFVFPSLYEGFGMPVLEARACQTKTVATDIPELREAGGCWPMYIQPDADGIRKGILAMVSSKQPAGPDQLWTWRMSAEILANAIDPNGSHVR